MRLGVLTGVVGAPTETFVSRHVAGLAPNDTAVVGRRSHPAPAWKVDAPALLLDPLSLEYGGAGEVDARLSFLIGHGVEVVLAEFLDLWTPFVEALLDAGIPGRRPRARVRRLAAPSRATLGRERHDLLAVLGLERP